MATQSNEQFDDTNRGSMFRNKRKTTDRHPDYTGSINVEGVEYWVSAWSKFSPKLGENFLSCALTRKEITAGAPDMLAPTPVSERKENTTAQAGGASSDKLKFDDIDDDIPF